LHSIGTLTYRIGLIKRTNFKVSSFFEGSISDRVADVRLTWQGEGISWKMRSESSEFHWIFNKISWILFRYEQQKCMTYYYLFITQKLYSCTQCSHHCMHGRKSKYFIYCPKIFFHSTEWEQEDSNMADLFYHRNFTASNKPTNFLILV